MTANAYDVSSSDFDEKVLAASHRVPVLVDFWAPWCQPCRSLKPLLEKLAAEYGGRFLLAKLNSDENGEIAARYGVRSIPVVKAFVDGELADEFTGAQPEARVREFLDRLLPSLAEPLRLEALDARERGDHKVARELLAQVVVMDPGHEAAHFELAELNLEAKALDEAKQLLDAIAARVRDTTRLEALRARLQLEALGSGDSEALALKLAADPNDLATRLQLANALALAGNYRSALEHLLELVRRDRKWQEDAGRKTMLTLFNLLSAQPEQEALVREFRIALARTLN